MTASPLGGGPGDDGAGRNVPSPFPRKIAMPPSPTTMSGMPSLFTSATFTQGLTSL